MAGCVPRSRVSKLATLHERQVKLNRNSPIDIKTMVDDAHPTLKPRMDWTVEQVFVDRGKARKEGYDQFGVVRDFIRIRMTERQVQE